MKKTWRVKYAVASPGWRKRRILLPKEADNWPRHVRLMFRFVMRRRGWTWLGSYVRRPASHNKKVWSQHSWRSQAHDFAPPKKDRKGKTLTKRQRQRRGDRVFRLLRLRWPRAFLVVWGQNNGLRHRNGDPMHGHVERRPPKKGTPPK